MEVGKGEKKMEEMGRVIRRLEGEKEELREGLGRAERGLGERVEEGKRDKREIEGLKKRLIRAKIEAIHNIREVIV